MHGMWNINIILSFVILGHLLERINAENVTEITLGGLFSHNKYDEIGLRTFLLAIEYVNSNNDILPNITLKAIYNQTESSSPFDYINMACYLIQHDVYAAVGGGSSTTVKAVSPIFSANHIPLISPFATDPMLSISAVQHPYLFKMTAPDAWQCNALLDLMSVYGWQQMGTV